MMVFSTPEIAWSLWAAAFKIYMEGRKGRIYWRKRPKLHESIEGSFGVYCRVYIDQTRWPYEESDPPKGEPVKFLNPSQEPVERRSV